MAFVEICKNNSSFIRPNFRANEFYSTSAKYGYDVPDCHPMDEKLLDAAQFLRDFTGQKWSLTSTFRTLPHNRAIGSKDSSLHTKGMAIDIQPTNSATRRSTLNLLFSDIAQKGPIYQGLRERGINGIGVYDTFIHLDTRGNFTAWDESMRRAGIPKIDTNYMACIPEPQWQGLPYDEIGTCPMDAGDEKKKPGTWIEQLLKFDQEDGFSAHSFKYAVTTSIIVALIVAAIIFIYKRSRK